jgi:hypothetical protein
MTPNLDIPGNDALIDLGAQLETELAQAQEQLDFEVGQLGPDQQRLIRPGVKLALNTAVGVAGITLAPVTIGWSLVLTVISSGVTISDALDFRNDVGKVRAARRRIRHIRRLAADIVQELEEIERLLAFRLGGGS